MSKISRKPHVGEPALPSVWAQQRHLFNEPFVAHVLGLSWPNPDPAHMPPSRRVYDGLGGSVVAWQAEDLVSWIAINRPDRIPHLYSALRRHLMRLSMTVADLEMEFERGPISAAGHISH